MNILTITRYLCPVCGVEHLDWNQAWDCQSTCELGELISSVTGVKLTSDQVQKLKPYLHTWSLEQEAAGIPDTGSPLPF
jgi:hypothetical protein